MCRRIIPVPGIRLGERAQASLELALVLVCILLLLFGSFNVFIWVNQHLFLRQTAYEEQRVGAVSSGAGEVQVDESNFKKLRILGEPQ